MNTRRHPRTLEEAFGPYQRHGLFVEYDPVPKSDKIVIVASLAGLIALGAFDFLGWL